MGVDPAPTTNVDAENVRVPEWAEEVARRFHWHYERLATDNGWETQERSRVEWADLPEANRATMIATVEAVFEYSGNLWVELDWCHHRNMPLYSLRAVPIKDEAPSPDMGGTDGRT